MVRSCKPRTVEIGKYSILALNMKKINQNNPEASGLARRPDGNVAAGSTRPLLMHTACPVLFIA